MKDPAVLFFISDWLKATAEMDADCRGWYLNLILHNYDKKTLPNDIESLAVLAQVKFSEFERFKQVFEQVLKHKFEQSENNRLTNPFAFEVMKNRELFSEKRSDSGKISYLMRYFAKNHIDKYNNQDIRIFIRNNLDLSIDTKNEQMIEHMFKHLFELYTNENEIEIVSVESKGKKESTERKKTIERPEKIKYAEFVSMTQPEYDKLREEYNEIEVNEIIEILNNYKGSSGKKYKSDYLAIRNWVIDRFIQKHGNNNNQNTGAMGFGNTGNGKNTRTTVAEQRRVERQGLTELSLAILQQSETP